MRVAQPGDDDGQDADHHDDEKGDGEEASAAERAARLRRGGRLVGSRDDLLDSIEAGRDTVTDLSLAEARSDVLAENLARQGVGQLGLEAVPDLEAHLPVIHEDEKDDAVVEALLADAPGLGEADRVVFEVLAVEGAEDGHHDLVAALALPGSELLFEPLALSGREHAREVVDAVIGRRRDGQRRRRGADEDGEEEKNEPPDHSGAYGRPRGLPGLSRTSLSGRSRSPARTRRRASP